MTLKLSKQEKISSLLLRIGLAAVLLYACISSFVTPADWVGYLPQSAKRIIPGETLLHIFSVYELLLALWLLSGRYIKYAGAISALTFAAIILSNLSLMAITFRDIALVFTSLALMFTRE